MIITRINDRLADYCVCVSTLERDEGERKTQLGHQCHGRVVSCVLVKWLDAS